MLCTLTCEISNMFIGFFWCKVLGNQCSQSGFNGTINHLQALQRMITKREKYLASHAVEENVSLMSGVRGQKRQIDWRPKNSKWNLYQFVTAVSLNIPTSR